MGSGKTSVGNRVAEFLGWRFFDSDQEIERRLDRTVSEIFQELGESAFRETERTVVAQALQDRDIVVSTGGGWAAQEGSIESLPSDTFVVWLQVSAEEAFRRVGSGADRPLLNRPDALHFAKDLLRRRLKRYALAHQHYDTSSADAQELAERICAAMGLAPRRQATEVADTANTPEKEE